MANYSQRIMIRVFLLIFMVSCQSPSYEKEELWGQWNKLSWTIEEGGDEISQGADFVFLEDGRYEVDYGGGVTEVGKYYIDGERLYTKEEGAAEKNVKILKLNRDSLVFEMNRAGRIELLTLGRVTN